MAKPWEAAGYGTPEEWAAAGWPHPIDPETGKPYEGYKILNIEAGFHPTGRPLTDADWFDPKTQALFDYFRAVPTSTPTALWDYVNQMRAKYPEWPVPGVNINDLLAKEFGEQGVAAPSAPAAGAVADLAAPPGEPSAGRLVATAELPKVSPLVQEWLKLSGAETLPPALEKERPALEAAGKPLGELIGGTTGKRVPTAQEWLGFLRKADLLPEEATVRKAVAAIREAQKPLEAYEEVVAKQAETPKRPEPAMARGGPVPREVAPGEVEPAMARALIESPAGADMAVFLKKIVGPLAVRVAGSYQDLEKAIFVVYETGVGSPKFATLNQSLLYGIDHPLLTPPTPGAVEKVGTLYVPGKAPQAIYGAKKAPIPAHEIKDWEDVQKAWMLGQIGYSLMRYPERRADAWRMLEEGKSIEEIRKKHEDLGTEMIGQMILDPIWLVPPAWIEKVIPLGKLMGAAVKGLEKVPGVRLLAQVTKKGQLRAFGFMFSDALDTFLMNIPKGESVTSWMARWLAGDEEVLRALGPEFRRVMDEAVVMFRENDPVFKSVLKRYSPEVLLGMPPHKRAKALEELGEVGERALHKIIRRFATEEELLQLAELSKENIGQWIYRAAMGVKSKELGIVPLARQPWAKRGLSRTLGFLGQLWKENILPYNIRFHLTNLIDSTMRMSLRGFYWRPWDLPVVSKVAGWLGEEQLSKRTAQMLSDRGLVLPHELQRGLIGEFLGVDPYGLSREFTTAHVPIPLIGKPGAMLKIIDGFTSGSIMTWAGEKGIKGVVGKVARGIRFEEAGLLAGTRLAPLEEKFWKGINRVNLASLVEAGANLNIEPLVRISTFAQETAPKLNAARLEVAQFFEDRLIADGAPRKIAQEVADQIRNPNIVQSVLDLENVLGKYAGKYTPRLEAFSLPFLRHSDQDIILQDVGKRLMVFTDNPTDEKELRAVFSWARQEMDERLAKSLKSYVPEQLSVEQLRMAGAPNDLLDILPEEIARRKAEADALEYAAYRRAGAVVERLEGVTMPLDQAMAFGRDISRHVRETVWDPHWTWYKGYLQETLAKIEGAKAKHDQALVGELWDTFFQVVRERFTETGKKAAEAADNFTRQFLDSVPLEKLAGAAGVPVHELGLSEAVEVTKLRGELERVVATAPESWSRPLIKRLEDIEKRVNDLLELASKGETVRPKNATSALDYVLKGQRAEELQVEIDALREAIKGMPPHDVVFRLWDYRNGRFKKYRMPSGQIWDPNWAKGPLEEIAFELGYADEEVFKAAVEKSIEARKTLKALEAELGVLPEVVIPGDFAGLKKFLERTEKQLDKLLTTGREPELFEAGLRTYEMAVDRFKDMARPILEQQPLDKLVMLAPQQELENLDTLIKQFDGRAVSESAKAQYQGLVARRNALAQGIQGGPALMGVDASKKTSLIDQLIREEAARILGEDQLRVQQARALYDRGMETLGGWEAQAVEKFRTIEAEQIAKVVEAAERPIIPHFQAIADEGIKLMAERYEKGMLDGLNMVHTLFYNYVEQRGIDAALGWMSPFVIWQLRNPFGWAREIARRPGLIHVISGLAGYMETQRGERGLSGRFRWTIPLPDQEKLVKEGVIAPGYYALDITPFYSIFQQIPALRGEYPWGITDEPLVGKIIRAGEFVGIRIWPWYQLGLEQLGMYDSVPAGDLAYVTKYLRLASRAFGYDIDIERDLRQWRDRNDDGGIARYYANLRLLDYFFATEMGEPINGIEVDMSRLKDAVSNPDDPLFKKAYDEAAEEQFKRSLVAGLFPLTIKNATPAEAEARRLQKEYFAIPEDDKEARSKFIDEHPLLVAYWAVLKDPDEARTQTLRQEYSDRLDNTRLLYATAMSKTPLGSKGWQDLAEKRREELETIRAEYPTDVWLEDAPYWKLVQNWLVEGYFNIGKEFFDEEGNIKDPESWPEYFRAREDYLNKFNVIPNGRLDFERYLAKNATPEEAALDAWEQLYARPLGEIVYSAKLPFVLGAFLPGIKRELWEKVGLLKEIPQGEKEAAKDKADLGRNDIAGLLREVLRLHPDWDGEQLARVVAAAGRLPEWDTWARRNDDLRGALGSVIWQGYMGLPELDRRNFRDFLTAELDPNVVDSFSLFFLNKDRRNIADVSTKVLLQIADKLGGLGALEKEGFIEEIQKAEREYGLKAIGPVEVPPEPALRMPAVEGGATGGGAPGGGPPTPEGKEPQPPRYGGEAFQPTATEAENERYKAYLVAMKEYQGFKATDPLKAKEYVKRPEVQALFDEFAQPGPSSNFWDYYFQQIPPGSVADAVAEDPIVALVLKPEYRALLVPEAYTAALQVLQEWRKANEGKIPGDPKEWALVRGIRGKMQELRDAGAEGKAMALRLHFAPILMKYYPDWNWSYTGIPQPWARRQAQPRESQGAEPATGQRWRRWPGVRYYPRR